MNYSFKLTSDAFEEYILGGSSVPFKIEGSDVIHGDFCYIIKCLDRYKIGFSRNPRQRAASLANTSPGETEVVATCPGSLDLEYRFHWCCASTRLKGEWFGASKDLDTVVAVMRILSSAVSIIEEIGKKCRPILPDDLQFIFASICRRICFYNSIFGSDTKPCFTICHCMMCGRNEVNSHLEPIKGDLDFICFDCQRCNPGSDNDSLHNYLRLLRRFDILTYKDRLLRSNPGNYACWEFVSFPPLQHGAVI